MPVQPFFFDIGSHGAIDGTYALKLATRPRPGHMALAIKRLTFVRPGPVQLEAWFTFKAEQTFGRRRDRSNDRTLDLREIPVPRYPDASWGLERLLNFSLDVRTHTPVRNFLFMDSFLVSVDW